MRGAADHSQDAAGGGCFLNLLVNIDVDDLERAAAFYCQGLGLQVGRRFDGWLELVGGSSRIYLLPKEKGSRISPVAPGTRDYARHWTPVHLDFVVQDIDAALARAQKAGATVERQITEHAYGRLALLADPFGNGFCLIEFRGGGYDAIAR